MERCAMCLQLKFCHGNVIVNIDDALWIINETLRQLGRLVVEGDAMLRVYLASPWNSFIITFSLRLLLLSILFSLKRKGIIKNTFIMLESSVISTYYCSDVYLLLLLWEPPFTSLLYDVRWGKKRKKLMLDSSRTFRRKNFSVHEILWSFVMPTIFNFLIDVTSSKRKV